MKGRGFTLIELLVVIAIIGILVAIIVPSLSGSRTKTRDAARVSQLRQIRYALEIYYSDNGTYPTCLYGGGTCVSSLNGSAAMSSVPKDPNGKNYSYAAFGSDCSSFHLGAMLEVLPNATAFGSDADAPRQGLAALCTGSLGDFSGLSGVSAAPGLCGAVANGVDNSTEHCYDFTN